MAARRKKNSTSAVCGCWIALVRLVIAFRAILVRFVFLGLTISFIMTVVNLKQNRWYWLLCLFIIPLLTDVYYSIRSVMYPRTRQEFLEKWFTMCVFAYLLCACPPIWIVELHIIGQIQDGTDDEDEQQEVLSNPTYGQPNEGNSSMWNKHRLVQAINFNRYPLKDRIRIMEQMHVLCIIVGRWVLPRYGISKDQLSQMLLVNIGNAADILELMESLEDDDVQAHPPIMILIIIIWQISLLQFVFNRTATIDLNIPPGQPPPPPPSKPDRKHKHKHKHKAKETDKKGKHGKKGATQPPDGEQDTNQNNAAQVESQTPICSGCSSLVRWWRNYCLKEGRCGYIFFGTELWAICLSLLLQDVPFLFLRLVLIFEYTVQSHSNVFFLAKNTLLIMLQIYRSMVILQEDGNTDEQPAQQYRAGPLLA